VRKRGKDGERERRGRGVERARAREREKRERERERRESESERARESARAPNTTEQECGGFFESEPTVHEKKKGEGKTLVASSVFRYSLCALSCPRRLIDAHVHTYRERERERERFATVRTHLQPSAFLRMFERRSLCMYVCMYVCMYIYTCVHIHKVCIRRQA